MTSLQTLLTEGIVDEVLGQLKSGKEADVWLVRRAEEILAAKIYKEREHRSFKNNAEYKEGRQVRNTRTQRAMARGSKFGREADEAEWKAAEADALFKLHAAGARVPRPSMFFEGVLLMEVVIDPEGHPAPRLVDAVIPREQGLPMYEDLRSQAVKLLCADLIHGDLSEFNVLLAWDGPTIIDFPQVISAAQNSRAEHFFKRDIDNLRRFFATVDPAVGQRESDADEIWRAYVRRELTAEFVPTGRAVRKQQQQQGRPRHHRGGPPAPQRAPAGAEVSYRGRPQQAATSGQPPGQNGQPQRQPHRPGAGPPQAQGAHPQGQNRQPRQHPPGGAAQQQQPREPHRQHPPGAAQAQGPQRPNQPQQPREPHRQHPPGAAQPQGPQRPNQPQQPREPHRQHPPGAAQAQGPQRPNQPQQPRDLHRQHPPGGQAPAQPSPAGQPHPQQQPHRQHQPAAAGQAQPQPGGESTGRRRRRRRRR